MPHNRRVPDHDENADESDRDESDRGESGDADPGPAEEPAGVPAELPEEPPRRATGLSVGYRADEVDAFLAELWKAMDRPQPAMAPYEVADARFKATRVRRRYQMRSVDDYLERIQAVLRERHGADAVADVEGHLSTPRHVRTGWIYAVALVLIVVMLAFAFTQL